MTKHLFCSILALSVLGGCKKEAAKDPAAKTTETAGGGTAQPTEAAKPADGLVAIPNSDGLVAKVPAGAKPNAMGGAAGFHSDDETFQFMVREVSAEEAGQSFEDAKEGTLAVKKWIKAEKTGDGWVMQYVVPYMKLKGEEMVEDGERFAFDVRRKVGEKVYSCSGSLAKEDGYGAVVEACNSVKAK